MIYSYRTIYQAGNCVLPLEMVPYLYPHTQEYAIVFSPTKISDCAYDFVVGKRKCETDIMIQMSAELVPTHGC